jgi:hypothetical protein
MKQVLPDHATNTQYAPLDPAQPPTTSTVAPPVSQSPGLEVLTTVIAAEKPDHHGGKESDNNGTGMDIDLPVDFPMDLDTPTADSRNLVDNSYSRSNDDATQAMNQEAGESLIGISNLNLI